MIIPIEPSFFSLHGLAKITETIEWLRGTNGKSLQVHALLTRFEKRTRLTREIAEEVKRYFKEELLTHPIRENVRLKEAAAAGKSIVDFDREASGFQDYVNLAIEIIERGMLRLNARLSEITSPAPNLSAPPAPVFQLPPSHIPQTDIADHLIGTNGSSDTNGSLSTNGSDTNGSGNNGALVQYEFAEVATAESAAESIQTNPKISRTPHPALGGYLFLYRNPEAKEVLVAGDFNHWVGEAMIKVDSESDRWQKILMIEPGVYRYKFIVNGEWLTDPSNSLSEPTPYGNMNSVVEVK